MIWEKYRSITQIERDISNSFALQLQDMINVVMLYFVYANYLTMFSIFHVFSWFLITLMQYSHLMNMVQEMLNW